MGREIRMVPPNWEHPKKMVWDYRTSQEVEKYQPLYDRSYSEDMSEWIKNHQLWEKMEHPDQIKNPEDTMNIKYYAQWDGGPPDYEYYRPEWEPQEATWYQVYETVSEGTPVTPPFETRDELIDYLVENGDFWDQRRRRDGDSFMPCAPWTREQAERFVNQTQFALSMVIDNGKMSDGIGREI